MFKHISKFLDIEPIMNDAIKRYEELELEMIQDDDYQRSLSNIKKSKDRIMLGEKDKEYM